MARIRRNASAVSLFPFLAVLMCTMGALIVLLVVISQQIRDDAIAKAHEERAGQQEAALPHPQDVAVTDEPPVLFESELTTADEEPLIPELAEDPPAPLPSLPDLDSLRRALDGLQRDEDTLADELRQRRLRIASLTEQQDRLSAANEKLQTRRDEVEALVEKAVAQRSTTNARRDAVDANRRRLAKLINDSRQLLSDEQKHQEAGNPFVIVPFDGGSGTTRRPILLECTDKAIRFVAEDIELTPSQLLPFSAADNPLLAGSRELVRFWSAWGNVQDDPESAPKPYVLLVVRPSGTVAFYVARRFLSELGADFGYELVEDDFDYAVPETDPRATELCRAAVRQALQKKTVSPNGPSTFARGLESGRKRASGGGIGNDGAASGPAGRERSSSESFADAERSGNSFNRLDVRALRNRRGTASQRFFSSEGFRDRRRVPPAARNGSGSNGRPMASPNSAQAPAGEIADRTPTEARSGRIGSSPLTPQPQLKLRASATSESSAGTGTQDPLALLNNGIPLVSTPGAGESGSQPHGQGRANDLLNASRDGQGGAGDDRNVTSQRQGMNPSADRSITETQSSSSPALTGQDSSGDTRRHSTGRTRSQAARPGDGSEGIAAPRVLQSLQQSTSPLFQPAKQSDQSGSGAPSGGGSTSSTKDDDGQTPLPTLSMQQGAKPRRGFRRSWGIHNPNGTIALEKAVPVRLSKDRIVIGNKLKITRQPGRTRQQLVDWTILAIDRVVHQWGKPPRNFYWVPEVELSADDNSGLLLMEAMRTALTRTGVTVSTSTAPRSAPTARGMRQ